MSRYGTHLIGTEGYTEPEGDDGWLLSYLDVLTLIIALFVLLLAFSETSPRLAQMDEDSESPAAATATAQRIPMTDRSGLLPEDMGLRPQQQQLEQRIRSLELQGVDATPTPEGVTLRIADNLLFDSGQAELTEAGKGVVAQLQPVLASFEGEISVEGHTDSIPISTPRFPSNWELSSARAISVLRFLQEQGIDQERMRAIGYAETRPLESNDSPAGRAANRRVELLLRDGG